MRKEIGDRPSAYILLGAALAFILMVAALGLSPTQLSRPETQGHSQQQPERIQPESNAPESFWKKTASDPIAVYTLALVVFTAVLASVSIVQVYFLTRADKTARISAEATRASSQMVIDTERARLLPFISRSSNLSIDATNYDPELPTAVLEPPLVFELYFRNYGRTPAIVEYVTWDLVIETRMTKQKLPLISETRTFEPEADAVINGNERSDAFELVTSVKIRRKAAYEVKFGIMGMSVSGKVRFRNIFGDYYDTAFLFEYHRPNDVQDGRMVLAMSKETKVEK